MVCNRVWNKSELLLRVIVPPNAVDNDGTRWEQSHKFTWKATILR